MTKEFVFIERSIWSDKNVFAKNCYENGMISDIEYRLYNKWFEFLRKSISIPAHSYLYLRCPAEVSYERLNMRARQEESSVGLDYLKQIERQHESWLKDKPLVMTIDATIDYKNEETFRQIFETIMDF